MDHTDRESEKQYLKDTLEVVENNLENYGSEVARMQAQIDEMLEHYHDNDVELWTLLNNTITMNDHMKRALQRNERARSKPYFGRIIFRDETLGREESLYIGKGGISRDNTNWIVIDWRAPVANAYYENGLGKCSYTAPGGRELPIDLQLKRTYEIEEGQLRDYFDTEVIANDDLLMKYLSKNKEAVLGEIVATIQKEQNEIIRKSPCHNVIVQGVAGSGKTTVAMHRISYILYNYKERFRPEDFYIVGSNRILLNYITGVLPDLDVYGVKQMTMEQLFIRLLYEDWDEKKYRVKPVSGKPPFVKGTEEWFLDLEAFIRRLELKAIRRDNVWLEPRQFVEGLQDGKNGIYDRREEDRKAGIPSRPVKLVEKEAVERYVAGNPTVSIQSKINMLNDRLIVKIRDEFLGKGVKYTEEEKKAILRAYRGYYGPGKWKRPIYELYGDFLEEQRQKGLNVESPTDAFDVYDLAALALLYKWVKETEVISEAHHIVIDEAQDFGMMAYRVLHACIRDCTYTIMGDVSQNIHFGYGLGDWEALRRLILPNPMDSFGLLKKSYRNTVEISDFATAALLSKHIPILESDLEKADFGSGIMVLPVEYTKGLEFDTVLIWNPTREDYPVDDGDAKLLYVAATRALHELHVLYRDSLTGLIADPVPDRPLTSLDAGRKSTEDQRKSHRPKTENTRDNAASASRCCAGKRNAALPGTGQSPAPGTRLPGSPGNRPRAKAASNVILHTPEYPEKPSRPAAPPEKISAAPTQTAGISFGDMPATEKLRCPGHAKISLGIRWVSRQADGLYLQSQYGTLRISPMSGNILRMTFSRGSKITDGVHPLIAVSRTEKNWRYRDSTKVLELSTGEVTVRVEKTTGAISFLDGKGNLLLAEKKTESRQLEGNRNWLFWERQKKEQLFARAPEGQDALKLCGSAFYISDGTMLPFLLSDRGYGILPATLGNVICCDIPAYGSWLCMEPLPSETGAQQDYYFLAGKQQNLLNAFAYLCGTL